jgi:hypothetical protein
MNGSTTAPKVSSASAMFSTGIDGESATTVLAGPRLALGRADATAAPSAANNVGRASRFEPSRTVASSVLRPATASSMCRDVAHQPTCRSTVRTTRPLESAEE